MTGYFSIIVVLNNLLRKYKSSSILILLLGLCLLSHERAFAFKRPKLETYTVEGLSTVVEQNFENARIEATSEAMKNAIRLAVADVGGAELFFEKTVEIQKFIDEYHEKYIQGYRVLNETIEEDYYSVTLSATVFVNSIKIGLHKADIGSIDEPLKILVLIDDKASPIYSKENFLTLFSVTEDAIIKRLSDEAWNVIGRNNISVVSDFNNIITAFTGDPDATVSLGEELELDIVILGTTSVVYTENANEAEETKIELSARIVSVEDDEILGDIKEMGISEVEDPVLAAAQSMRDSGNKAAIRISTILKEQSGQTSEEYPFFSEPEINYNE